MEMRYNEEAANNSKPIKEKKTRELPSQGKYTSKELEKSKNIPWRK